MRRRLIGLAALIGIIAILVGVPALLWVLVGPPWPTNLSAGDITGALLRPDDGSTVITILTYIAWLAWLTFAAMIVLEIAGSIRGVRVPPLPGLRVQQRAAAGLVAAVALLFTTAGVATLSTPAPAQAALGEATSQTVQASSTATVPQQGNDTPRTAGRATAPAAADQAPAAPQYRVKQGDTLWSIAEQHLGDGARYAEIATLNYGKAQPDGRALETSHWLRPGWTLTLPTDARAGAQAEGATRGGGEVVVHKGDTLSGIAEEQLGDADAYPDLFDASRGTTQPGGRHLTDPDHIEPGWRITVPGDGAAASDPTPAEPAAPPREPAETSRGGATETPSPSAATPSTQPASPEASTPTRTGSTSEDSSETRPDRSAAADEAADSDDVGYPVRTISGVGMLLAAGVLGVIAYRRRRQHQRRQPGQPLPELPVEAAAVERDLRAAADPLSVETVDLALRTLGRRCAELGQPLPQVRAARLTAGTFELYLAAPAHLPPPFTEHGEDQTVWTMAADPPTEQLLTPDEATRVTAPYPSLVSLGHDEEDGTVMVDLEHLGTLAVTGADHEQTRWVLAALAVEISTSSWADDAQVTFVGAYSELAQAIGTGRVRYLPTMGHLLEQLQARADRDRTQLRQTAGGDLAHARVTGEAEDAWTPEIVVMVSEPTTDQVDQLTTLLEELPRVAIAAVTRGTAIGDWSIELTGTQDGVLHPIELPLRPQLLDDTTYGQILEVIAVADDDSTDPGWQQPEPRLEELVGVPEVEAPGEDHAGEDPIVSDTSTLLTQEELDPEPQVDTAVTTPGEEQDGLVDELAAASSPAVQDGAERDPDQQQNPTRVVESDAPRGTPSAIATTAYRDGADGTVAALRSDTDGITIRTPDPAIGPDGEEPDVDGQRAAGADDDEVVMPERMPWVQLLGPVTLMNPAGPPCETSKRAQLTELVAILAAHPQGLTTEDLEEAMWPGREVSRSTRVTALSKLRRWIGATPEGAEYLPSHTSPLQLRPEISTDWDRWQQLLPDGAEHASTPALTQALALVHGRPLSGGRPRRYVWAEPLRTEITVAVVDAAYQLAHRHLLAGRWLHAQTAATRGLEAEPGWEPLWRIRLMGAHAAGNAHAVEELTRRLLDITDELGGELDPKTEELLEQLQEGRPPVVHAL